MELIEPFEVISSNQRGTIQTDGLLSRHIYSFGDYYNLERLNFGTLRVFNDAILKPGGGLGTHLQKNMEIVTIVLQGALMHEDSIGHAVILRSGCVQRISAGKGIEYSVCNASEEKEVHFLQIWIYPEQWDLEPSYQQKFFAKTTFCNCLVPIVMANPSHTCIGIHQDAVLSVGMFEKGGRIERRLSSKARGLVAYVIEGEMEIGSSQLRPGDAAQIRAVERVEMAFSQKTHLLIAEVDINTL